MAQAFVTENETSTAEARCVPARARRICLPEQNPKCYALQHGIVQNAICCTELLAMKHSLISAFAMADNDHAEQHQHSTWSYCIYAAACMHIAWGSDDDLHLNLVCGSSCPDDQCRACTVGCRLCAAVAHHHCPNAPLGHAPHKAQCWSASQTLPIHYLCSHISPVKQIIFLPCLQLHVCKNVQELCRHCLAFACVSYPIVSCCM